MGGEGKTKQQEEAYESFSALKYLERIKYIFFLCY